MSNRQAIIVLTPKEKKVLENEYLKRRISVDKYPFNPKELQGLCEDFYRKTGRSDPPEVVWHYMLNKRKEPDWPRLSDDKKGIAVRKKKGPTRPTGSGAVYAESAESRGQLSLFDGRDTSIENRRR